MFNAGMVQEAEILNVAPKLCLVGGWCFTALDKKGTFVPRNSNFGKILGLKCVLRLYSVCSPVCPRMEEKSPAPLKPKKHPQ